MTMRIQTIPNTIAAVLAFSTSALAETYCVTTPAAFLNAKTLAQSTPSASEIRIVQGVYDFSAPSANASAISIQDNSGLTIQGGYLGNCAVEPSTFNPELTVLRVANTGPLVDILVTSAATGDISISRLSLRQGTSANVNFGGCLNIDSDVSSIAVRLSHLSFRLCSSSVGAGAALWVTGRGMRFDLINSVFADNSSQAGVIRLSASGNSVFYLTNNTVAFNPKPSALNGPAGLQLTNFGGGGFFWMSNNVLYGNGSLANDTDVLYNGDVIGVISSNIIGRSNPVPASASETNNSNANPLLASSVNLKPSAISPMRNSGNNSPPGGLPSVDFDSNARVLGGRVDRGAFEFDEQFANGFE